MVLVCPCPFRNARKTGGQHRADIPHQTSILHSTNQLGDTGFGTRVKSLGMPLRSDVTKSGEDGADHSSRLNRPAWTASV